MYNILSPKKRRGSVKSILIRFCLFVVVFLYKFPFHLQSTQDVFSGPCVMELMELIRMWSCILRVRVMVFSASFNNISVIS